MFRRIDGGSSVITMAHSASPEVRACCTRTSEVEDIAVTGLCGNVHLSTGRTCDLPERHEGSCHFVGPEDAENLAAR